MRIEWKITKKRGNLRPVLSYSASLDEHEKLLALPCVSVLSTIPRPEEERQEYCYPDQYERKAETNDRPVDCYILEIPSHKGHSWRQHVRLPWRESNSYPEVEASFQLLRAAFEKELAAAHSSQPMEEEGALACSTKAKAAIAPEVLAERFLNFAERNTARAG